MEGLHEPVLREVDALGLRRTLFTRLHVPRAAGQKANFSKLVLPELAREFLACTFLQEQTAQGAQRQWPLLAELLT